MFGVITDLGFPRLTHTSTAGLKFAAHVKELTPELPVLVQSSQSVESQYAEAGAPGCKFVCKTSPTLLQSLRDYFRDDLLFGLLKFQDGATGEQLGTVSNVSELARVWAELPLSSVGYRAPLAPLALVLRARGVRAREALPRVAVPAGLHRRHGQGAARPAAQLDPSEVRAHRKLASTVENVQTADATTPIVRLGSGSLGGKGRGFRFLHNLSEKINMTSIIPDVELAVSLRFILATSVFDDFMESNELVRPRSTRRATRRSRRSSRRRRCPRTRRAPSTPSSRLRQAR